MSANQEDLDRIAAEITERVRNMVPNVYDTGLHMNTPMDPRYRIRDRRAYYTELLAYDDSFMGTVKWVVRQWWRRLRSAP